MGIHKVVLGSLRTVAVACVAATTLPVLSACATDSTFESESPEPSPSVQQVVETPPDRIIDLANGGWRGFLENFTNTTASATTREMLPEELQDRNLLETTTEAKTAAGIVAGEFLGDTCMVLYMKRETEGRVGLAIATTNGSLQRESIWLNISGQEVPYYISKYCL
jgi:hypothetical protein